MRDDEISSSIAHLLIRHPITDDDELSGFNLPLSPSLLKTLLLRRLGSLLSSDDPFDETLELVAELDRDHGLSASPPPSLQLAYCALAVDATARWLKKGDWGGFLDAVERNWRVRVRDLTGSEAKGLASERLGREMMVMVEAAAGNGDVIEELRRRRRRRRRVLRREGENDGIEELRRRRRRRRRVLRSSSPSHPVVLFWIK